MTNVNIDAMRAAKWVSEVQAEIIEVNKTLKKANELTSTFPDQEDTFVRLIVETSNKIGTTWNRACDAYKNAWEKVEEGINLLGNAGGKVQELVEGFASRHAK